jgi:hypothetical protein
MWTSCCKLDRSTNQQFKVDENDDRVGLERRGLGTDGTIATLMRQTLQREATEKLQRKATEEVWRKLQVRRANERPHVSRPNSAKSSFP